ncbi:MAG: amino acid ABC transporter substrate-binding protein [Candidatus Melainabacteria bacterium]|nr:amino acid ABC transporter substrate-binding protein [Candidatus Melainabacteria bacterium]
MGTSAEYPPFEFQKNGKTVGIDLDIAQELADRLGYTLEVQEMEFPGIIPALQSGRLDFAMAGLTVTPERQKSVDFSRIYYTGTFSLLTRKDRPAFEGHELAARALGVQLGSVMEKLAKEKAPSARLLALGKNNLLIEELKAGRIEGVLLEEDQAIAFAQVSDLFQIQPLKDWIAPGSQDGYAIAFPKGSPLKPELDKALDALIQDGKITQILKKWTKLKD